MKKWWSPCRLACARAVSAMLIGNDDAAEMRHLATRKKDVLTYYLYMD